DPRFRPLPSAVLEATRARLGLPANFVLFVGTLEPRKNLPRLVRAFARLADSDLHLVIAGRRGWLYEETFATVERLGLQNRVHFLDFVADADLPALYNLARAFVYPSLYEGFGLPVLEALACGAPVVTSGVSSLIEVAGEAAVLVDPLDEAAIAGGITRALRDAARLRGAGPAQAQRFRWETAAQRLLACYRTLSAGGPSKGSRDHVFTERSDR
ncbi:MAG: glycosyltransferase family 4 protein, partial [Chloroflexaceae bacterium]